MGINADVRKKLPIRKRKEGKCSALERGVFLSKRTKGQVLPQGTHPREVTQSGAGQISSRRAWGLANNGCCTPPTPLELNFKF